MKLETIKATEEELRVMLESGLVLREAGRLDEAEDVFRGVLELVPRSDVPLVALSSIAVRRGNFDEALRLCEEALEYSSDSVFAQLNHAEILLYQKRLDEAEQELQNIVKHTNVDSPHRRTALSLLESLKFVT